MAIAFARFDFASRSSGKNACMAAAYQTRSKICFYGHKFATPKTYDWSSKEKPLHSEILLPEGVDARFKNTEVLWNYAEKVETRKNSQVYIDGLLALPDDDIITPEEKVYLAKTFLQKMFVDKGLGVQFTVHPPDESGKNWHAHFMVLTRRFNETGKELGEKARDLLQIRKGKAINLSDIGEYWAKHQNEYFEAKGIELRVDPSGIISQIHMGPVRMRNRSFSLLNENQLRIELNEIESLDPSKILKKLTTNSSVFDYEAVSKYIEKHVPEEFRSNVEKHFFRQKNLVTLFDDKKNYVYTTKEIIKEERLLLKLAESIRGENSKPVSKNDGTLINHLSNEQKKAFNQVLKEEGLSCIEGHAGTGKSYLLSSLKATYEKEGYIVRTLGPDSSTAEVLNSKGMTGSRNVYDFLFSVQFDKLSLNKDKEVWIVDEAGKLSNQPTTELFKLAKKYNAKLILSGCSAQLSPVKRGNIFSFLSKKFGASILEDIQRQKDIKQKEISICLAKGEMAVAIDSLSKNNKIKWVNSQKEAIENVVKEWGRDRQRLGFNLTSTKIIAYTNREVKAINEMVRLLRIENGEIGRKEFECKTTKGTIYVSKGDLIEFKANNRKLGVYNGLSGILVKASEDQFVVRIQEDRDVTFNPKIYNSFSLGYATTVVRSQGITVDKAYVVFSPYMGKKDFYVSATRHVKDMSLYVNKRQVKNIAELKKMAFVEPNKATTLEFSTDYLLEKELELASYSKQVDKHLSFKDSFQNFAFSKWEEIKHKIETFFSRKPSSQSKIHGNHESTHNKLMPHELEPDFNFYYPYLEDTQMGDVKTVAEQDNIKFLEPDMLVNKVHEKVRKISKQINKEAQLANKEPRYKDQTTSDSKHTNKWVLKPEEGKAVKSYLSLSAQATDLQTIVQLESSSDFSKQQNAKHFKEWMEVCKNRNRCAAEIKEKLKPNVINKIFTRKEINSLNERALKHQNSSIKTNELDKKLKENVDLILYKLFPEGPTSRDSRGLRFGRKGSLSVSCKGDAKGLFYDHENKKGGNLVGLISLVLNLNKEEALQWAASCLGEQNKEVVPSQFKYKTHKVGDEGVWISVKPSSTPNLKEIRPSLFKYYTQEACYTYKTEFGEPLYYIYRLKSKTDNQKLFIPLSYGHIKGSKNMTWAIKNANFEGQHLRPLYNVDLIAKFPTAKILIVEGEKAADAASKMFKQEDIICLTWQGGASSVSKSNWEPLFGREIIIWPDNDKAGEEAGEKICQELRKVGVRSLKMVDPATLKEKLPSKWDLADPIPENLPKNFVHQSIYRANPKTIGIDKLKGSDKCSEIELIRRNEILWRVENRLRSELEKKMPNEFHKIDAVILQEFKLIYATNPIEKRAICKNQFLDERLSFKTKLLYAEKGKIPDHKEVLMCRDHLKSFMQEIKTYSKSEKDHLAIDKAFASNGDHLLASKSYERQRMTINSVIFRQNELMNQFGVSKQVEKEIS